MSTRTGLDAAPLSDRQSLEHCGGILGVWVRTSRNQQIGPVCAAGSQIDLIPPPRDVRKTIRDPVTSAASFWRAFALRGGGNLRHFRAQNLQILPHLPLRVERRRDGLRERHRIEETQLRSLPPRDVANAPPQ